MRTEMRATTLAAAALAALVLAAGASAAYTTPTLRVSQTATATTIIASAAVADDATARATIYVPNGVTATTNQAPGANVGTARAQVSALALGGALLPLEGQINVAPPGAVPAATQAACTQGQTPAATWLLVLQAAGQTINLPAYVLPTVGAETALGPLKITFCLAPPDLPPPTGATFGAKFLSAELTLNGVFSAVASGTWIAVWTPWQAGGTINTAATVASPASIAAGALTFTARRTGARIRVSGRVTQGGQPVAAASVRILRGRAAGRVAAFRTVRTAANGTFSLSGLLVRAGTYFRAATTVAARTNATGCTPPPTLPVPVPCVNATISGFTSQSAVVRAR